MQDLIATVRDTIRRYRMISSRDTVLAAVSGGADSVFMLHVLTKLRDELGFEVKVAHLDHGFRGEESRRDAEFVREVADDLGLLCICGEMSVPRFLLSRPMSAQDAARMLRYQFLVKTSKLEYCQRIATGHNADDQAETVLMRVIRGAGPDGLAGIPPKRGGTIIRPIIRIWRSEIGGYLSEKGLPYRTDESNLESKYTRNRVRNELLPVLEAYNPGVRQTLVNLGTIMTDVAAHLERATDLALPEVVERATVGQFVLDLVKLTDYDEALQRSVFRRIFESLRPDLPPLGFRHVENLLELSRGGKVGTSVELPDGARGRLEHGRLVVSHGEGPPSIPSVELEVPGTATFEEAALAITAEILPREALSTPPEASGDEEAFFDWDEIRAPVTVRPRREGDRFRPFGMDGTKSLKELFIDAKIPWSLRSAVPLLCDRESILWAVGVRRSATAAVTNETRRVLAVRARYLEESSGSREGPSH